MKRSREEGHRQLLDGAAPVEPARPPGSRLAVWAWICIVMTPVGWAVGVLAMFGAGEGAAGPAAILIGLLGVVCWLTPPTAAIILSVGSARVRKTSSRTLPLLSGVLLVASMITLSALGVGLGASFIAWVAVGAVLVFFAWRFGDRPDSPVPQSEHQGRAGKARL